MDMTSLNILNPWWESREALDRDEHLKQVSGRPYYFDNPLKESLVGQPGETYILRGSRQVGKTTLLKERIRSGIVQEGRNTRHCLYLSCEAIESFQELRELLTRWIRSAGENPLLICLDEITFVSNWQRALLWLLNAGLLKNSVTLITGSNARDLKRSSERFPGRRVSELKVYPLSVFDYEKVPLFQKYSPAERLDIFFRIGGFPHAIRDFWEGEKVSDTTYEAYANWIFGDAARFELNREILNHLLFRLFETQGTQVTWQRLVEKSPVRSHETAAVYVEHVELAFLCHILACYDPEKKMAAPRKAKKVYFIDPLLCGLAGGYLAGFRNTAVWWEEKLRDKEFRGRLFEATVVNWVKRFEESVYYWYSPAAKREVDLLIRRAGQIFLNEIKSAPASEKAALGRPVDVVTPEIFLRDFSPYSPRR